MKKIIFILVLMFLLPQVMAIGSNLKESYRPKETMIGQLSGGILTPITEDQIKIVRDGHVTVATDYGVVSMGNKYYAWAIAPQNPGNYTLQIRDIISSVNGAPEIVDFNKDFSVSGSIIEYSVLPGAIFARDDFEITAMAYNEQQNIEVDFPEQREIILRPGVNRVSFLVSDIIGTLEKTINFGIYSIPVYIVGEEYVCDDGEINGREVCDGENLNGETCHSASANYSSGELKCSSGCLSFDFSSCDTSDVECDSNHLDYCWSETNCVDADGYWYNQSCHKYEEGAMCDSRHRGLCLTAGTCLDADGYWYDGYCNDEKEPVCGDNKIEGKENCEEGKLEGKDCVALRFDGGNLSCDPDECTFDTSGCYIFSQSAPDFVFNPSIIRSTIMIEGDFPIYHFSIANNGVSPLRDLSIDYNPSKFVIVPFDNISIESGESANFNLTLRDSWRGASVKGVVIAYTGNDYEYLLLEINFTSDAGQVLTEYAKNSTASGPSYYCSELSGVSCGSGETCSGESINTIDVSKCCVGSCQSGSGSGKSWIGYLIAGILILVVAFIYLKFKKGGGGKLSSKV
jgi:hypothetical protein